MKKTFIFKLICLLVAVCMILPSIAACSRDDSTKDQGDNITEAPTTEAPTNEDPTTDEPTSEDPTTDEPTSEDPTTDEPTSEDPTTDEPTSEDPTTDEPTSEDPTTENPTEEITTKKDPDIEGLDIDSSNMHGNMQNIFAGDTVFYETVMFIDKGETKSLLFPIDEIISVQSYNGRRNYVEGEDYTVVNGKLHIPESSSINVITSRIYYNYSRQELFEKYNGNNVSVYWGEGEAMTQYQIRVTYKHSKTWGGFKQETYAKNYEGLIRKLMAGEDVTFIFYGDSITCGANSSWYVNTPTTNWENPQKAFYQWSYSMLFTQAIADLFGYAIDFIDVSHLSAIIKKPPEDYISSGYVEGESGTITYINTSVGGWTSEGGVNNFDKHIKPYIEQYGCDLFGVAFGMNDGGVDPSVTANNIKSIYQSAMAIDSDFYGLIVSTMVPNNKATNGWYGNQDKQETKLCDVVDYLDSNGIKSGIAKMTSVSLSMLENKEFRDYTGNNINHPNDFMMRVYAQTCLQAFIGYENMK